jgi:hypothetical protein
VRSCSLLLSLTALLWSSAGCAAATTFPQQNGPFPVNTEPGGVNAAEHQKRISTNGSRALMTLANLGEQG